MLLLKISKIAETGCSGTQAKYISPPCFDPELSPPSSPQVGKYKPGTNVPFNSVYYLVMALTLDNGSVINFPKASLVAIK